MRADHRYPGRAAQPVELSERSRADQERAELQGQMLQAQRERLAEMSPPLVPITERIMVMPLIGSVDSEHASQIREVALTGAQHSGAKGVILDITGLRHIDTSIADSLIKTARALRLLGSHAILTGVRAGVAQTLVGLGVELSSLETRSTLQSAIAFDGPQGRPVACPLQARRAPHGDAGR